MAETKTVRVTLTGSPIGQTERQRGTLRGLGLTKRGKTVSVRGDAPTLGMIKKVLHLVRVES